MTTARVSQLAVEALYAPDPPTPVTWEATAITSPGGTGSVTYTPAGWGGGSGGGGSDRILRGLIFFGTNWTAEDTSDLASGCAIFRGMCAPAWDNPGTLLQNSAWMSPADQHAISDHAISMGTKAGSATTLYEADVVSIDPDGGFTLNWNVAASGYKLVVVGLFDASRIGAIKGTYSQTVTLGFKAGAALIHGAWGGPNISGSDRSQEFYGGAAYPGASNLGWQAAGANYQSFPTSIGQQYQGALNNFPPHIVIAEGQSFIGPFLTGSNIVCYPQGVSLFDFVFGGDGTNGGMGVVWDDEDSRTGRVANPSDTLDGTVTVSGLPFAPGLVIGYCISDEPGNQSSGAPRGAMGFAVITPDSQWSACVDGYSVAGAWQSFQRGFVTTVNGNNVNAGEVKLTDDGFVMTTKVNDASATNWLWHAFGHPHPKPMWLPPMSRVDYV